MANITLSKFQEYVENNIDDCGTLLLQGIGRDTAVINRGKTNIRRYKLDLCGYKEKDDFEEITDTIYIPIKDHNVSEFDDLTYEERKAYGFRRRY